ncbi:MAG: hypothetical protein M1396_04600 [Chloroflexi bacterium]|nr:hypothetical protein [Chloroflexota bacterium]
MNKQAWRLFLHTVAGTMWVVGLASAAKDKRWKSFGFALACHLAAETISHGGL